MRFLICVLTSMCFVSLGSFSSSLYSVSHNPPCSSLPPLSLICCASASTTCVLLLLTFFRLFLLCLDEVKGTAVGLCDVWFFYEVVGTNL